MLLKELGDHYVLNPAIAFARPRKLAASDDTLISTDADGSGSKADIIDVLDSKTQSALHDIAPNAKVNEKRACYCLFSTIAPRWCCASL
jgi:hypothetical protein